MDAQLQAIKDAIEPPLDADGKLVPPDFTTAYPIAGTYVEANPQLYTDEPYVTLLSDSAEPEAKDEALKSLVKSVETLRLAEMPTQQWQVEAFILHHVAPQSIGGVYRAQIKNT